MAKEFLKNLVNPFLEDDAEDIQRNRKKAWAFTVAFFAGLFIIFFFAALKAPQEEEGLRGIEVRLGEDAGGFDEPEEELAGDPAPETEEQMADAEDDYDEETEETEATEPEEDAVETEGTEPEPEREEEERQESAEEQTETEEEEPEIDTMALYTPGNVNRPEGDEDRDEVTGDPQGEEESDSPDEDGQTLEDAGGLSYELGGRRMSKAPEVEDETQKTGTVIVRITVNRDGDVIHARPGVRGSTTSDPELLELAEQSAYDTQFEPDPNAPEEHMGTMEFVFRLE